MAWAAAAPWIASAAGALLSGIFSKKGAEKQNETAIEMSQRQMEFEERMSSSAHQREVKDLAAAGLNPMLSGTGGAGSSTPSGSTPPIVNENEGLGRGIASAAQGAIQKRMQQAELNLMNRENDKKFWETEEAKTRISQLEQIMPYVVANAKGVSEGQSIANHLASLEVPGAEAEANIDRSSLGTTLRYLNRILDTGSSAVGMVNPIRGLMSPGAGVRRRGR